MRTNILPLLSSPGTTLQALQKGRSGASGDTADPKIRSAAREFEALLMEHMVKEMRKTVPESVFFKGPGHELFREMLDGEFVRLMGDRGGLGIADQLTEHLSKGQ